MPGSFVGEAAYSLKPEQARKLAVAIAAAPIPSASAQAKKIVDGMSAAQKERARTLLALPDLTREQWSELGRLTGLLDNVRVSPSLLGALRDRLGVQ